jgi:hypothetical protein
LTNQIKQAMHVHLRVGERSSGEPAFEAVHVLPLGGRRYKIEFTPGLAYGVAAGDEIELADDGTYAVVLRSGNVAVRVLSTQSILQKEGDLTAQVCLLGGRLDGGMNRGLAYTIPIGAGFPAIEGIFNAFVQAVPDAVWEYGNVYAEDGAPLGWWQGAM